MTKGNLIPIIGIIVMISIALWAYFGQFRPERAYRQAESQINRLDDMLDELDDHWDLLCLEQRNVASGARQDCRDAADYLDMENDSAAANQEARAAIEMLETTFPVSKAPWMYWPAQPPEGL